MNVQIAKDGLESALSRYRPRVRAFIAKMIQNEVDVEDLAQETMIKISLGWEKFRGDSTLSSWIFQIASNVCVDYFRSRSSRPGMAKGDKIVEAQTSDGVLGR